jgi:hypothetical protein
MNEVVLFGLPMWLGAVLLIEFGLWVFFSGEDRGDQMSFFGVLFFATACYAGGKPLLEWFAGHVFFVVAILLSYCALGLLWAFVKWYFYSLDALDAYESVKSEWLISKNIVGDTKTIPNALKPEWATYLGHYDYKIAMKNHKVILTPNETPYPVAKHHRDLIAVWITFWVPSMINSLTARLGRRVFQLFSTQFERMTKRIFARTLIDLPTQGGEPQG